LAAVEAALTEPVRIRFRSDLHLKSLHAETPGTRINATAKAALRYMIELIRERAKPCGATP
jgi:hypothetical protein